MIRLNITVDDISTVIQVYDQIQIQRAATDTGTFATVSGVGPVSLSAGTTSYTVTDADGVATDWYKSRYYSTSTSNYSSWSDPVLGESGDLFYNPLYPAEVSYGTSQQLTIKRIRTLIGDPVGLKRESGIEAEGSIHPYNKTYELEQKGWPASIHVATAPYNETTNPTVNGYRYLRFDQAINDTTVSGGVEYGVDVWYYSFRWSDREIMDTYDNTPPPVPLTTANATAEIYMLACAYDLLSNETWEDSIEDGAVITDEGSKYDPSPGLKNREAMLARLKKRLDDAIKARQLIGITGVLID